MLRNKFYGGVWLLLLFAIQPLSAGAERIDPFKIPHTFKDRLRQLTLEKEDIEKQNIESIQLPNLAVEGLIWGGTYPTAIINGKILKIGDEIDGAIVKQISKKGVILSYKGLEFILYSSGGFSKQKDNLTDKQNNSPDDTSQQKDRWR